MVGLYNNQVIQKLYRWRFPLIFLFLVFVFLLHYLVVGQAVYGDGRMYFSYARAVSIRGSIDIKEELQHIWSPTSNNSARPEVAVSEVTSYPHQSVGPIFLWVPAMWLASGFSFLTGMMVSGYSDIYQITTGVATILLFVLALFLVELLSRRKASRVAAFFSTITFLFATNLFYYTSIDVLNTHAYSFALSAFLTVRILTRKEFSRLDALIFGMLFANRPNDVLIFAPAAIYLVTKRLVYFESLLLPLFFLIGAMPQLAIWFVQFGRPLPPVIGGTWWNFDPLLIAKNAVSLLVDFPKGLVFSSPIVFFAFFGKQKGILNTLFLSGVLLNLLLISSWYAPFGGESYGVRFLISSYPVLIYWLAILASKILNKLGVGKIYLVVALLVLVNFTNIFTFMLFHTGHNKTGIDSGTWIRLNKLLPILPKSTIK